MINEHLYSKLAKWPTEAEKKMIKIDYESFTGF